MKINRLIGIITSLQQNEKLTTPYLANKFEVSRRTINRDIEDICRAGIPIVTQQGAGGGVWIMEGFKLNSSVFTTDELQSMLVGLKSLDSVSNMPKAPQIAEKLKRNSSFSENMIIDLASFYMDSLSDKIELIKTAVKECKMLKFHYYYNKGEADKLVEPYLIVYKWSDWYLFGWCSERMDFRMYKLNRLWDISVLKDMFIKREIPEEKMNFGSHISDNIFVKAAFDESVKYKLIEEYGPKCISEMADKRICATLGFSSTVSALEWFLSLGDKVEILEPKELRTQIAAAAKKIFTKY